jgi:hypothetical protein
LNRDQGAPTVIRNCKRDAKRLEPLKECMNNWGTDPGEWVTNYLSTKTVAFSCGVIARDGDAVTHDHDPEELALCKRLAREAAALMAGTFLCMGDESDHEFAPFFVTANAGAKVPRKLTDKHVRAAFGGTLWPECQITIEPLKARGKWWKSATAQATVDGNEKALGAWRRMVDWFAGQKELHGASFVKIEEPIRKGWHPALSCIFPRMVLAITEKGSLVGLYGCVVHT